MWRPPRAHRGWRTWTALHLAYLGRWGLRKRWLPIGLCGWLGTFALWLAGLGES